MHLFADKGNKFTFRNVRETKKKREIFTGNSCTTFWEITMVRRWRKCSFLQKLTSNKNNNKKHKGNNMRSVHSWVCGRTNHIAKNCFHLHDQKNTSRTSTSPPPQAQDKFYGCFVLFYILSLKFNKKRNKTNFKK